MLRKCSMISPAILSTLLLAAPAHAGDLVGSLGWYDFIDDEDPSTQLGLEYRLKPMEYGIRPTIGMTATLDGGVYGYGGVNWEVPLVDNQLYLIPNFMAGAYAQGDGKDLGHAIEFRSGIELSYQMSNAHRVGVALNHMSNAGLGDKNPGEETLLINYSIPAGNLF